MSANTEPASPLPSPESEWQIARLIYPLYFALARECVIDVLPCQHLENESSALTTESLDSVREWFLKMDERIQVHQFRHFLQTTTLVSGEALQALILHHLQKQKRTESDRNKLDFLLVQFFSLNILPRLAEGEIELSCVAQILEPTLGQFDLVTPEWLEPLHEVTRKIEDCRTLKELFTHRIIEQGRKLKESCGENYFVPIAMAEFTRFGFLMRRTFFRLMHHDLNAILEGLRELEARGIEGLDCRRAQFSAYEPMLRLRMICQSWKVMFHAEYSAGQPLCLLVDLRTVVDAALAKTASKAKPNPASGAGQNSRAAAAGARFGSGTASRSEFNVASKSTGGAETSAANADVHNKNSDSDN
ncbi:MAG: hypothetical protein ACRD2S_00475 [Terriglobales bacterium]